MISAVFQNTNSQAIQIALQDWKPTRSLDLDVIESVAFDVIAQLKASSTLSDERAMQVKYGPLKGWMRRVSDKTTMYVSSHLPQITLEKRVHIKLYQRA